MHLCLGEKGQDELHKRRPHLDLSTVRYPRMIDVLETEFKKERNETYETFQLLSRKQFINESLEQFHSVLSGLAARCNFRTLEDRILRDVFIVNMNNPEEKKELRRSTKTPEEVYRIALSYERGNKTRHLMLPRDRWEPNGHHQEAAEFRSKEDIVTIAQGAEVHTKGGDQIKAEICLKTIDATTATNKISQENIWTDVPRGELHAIFVINLEISNVLVGGSVEINEDGDRSE